MTLSASDVRHVASLARLKLSDEEVMKLQSQLSSILEHIAALDRVETSHIPPTAQVTNVANVIRDDDVGASLARNEVLANAPRQSDGFFEVDAILGPVEDP